MLRKLIDVASDAAKLLVFSLASILLVAIYFRIRIWAEGFKVTSWFRSPSHNEKVGGKSNSKHLIGWAFDVQPANSVTMDKLRKIGFRVVVNESSHLHAQVF